MINNEKISKLLDLFKEICYLSIIFFTPLYFALFLKNNNVFELNKLVLFKILVLILLFLTLLRQGFAFPTRLIKTNSFKYLIIPLIFLFSLSISTIFSINREVSFYGLSNRLQGSSFFIYYFLFFVLLLINIKSKEQINRIISAVIFSSFLVSVYGLIQAFGFDPLPWGESSKLRIFSTFGQPNLLASYLLLTIPLSIYSVFKNNKILFKIIYLIILIAQLISLFFTYSLSGWLGFILGGVFALVIFFSLSFPSRYSWDKLRRESLPTPKLQQTSRVNTNKDENANEDGKKKKYLIILFIALFLIFTIGSYFVYHKTSVRWTVRAKMQSLTNLQSGSFASRLNFWEASVKAISARGGSAFGGRTRLFIGYGPETQADSLIKYYQKDWSVTENLNIRPDRAHNLFLDILLTSGIFGLLSYLALLYLFFKLIFKIIKSHSEFSSLGYFILFALAAYLFALQLNFTFVVGEIYFWLYLALTIVIARRPSQADAAIPCQIKNHEDENKIIFIKTNLTPTLSLLRSGGKILLILIFIIGISYLINNQIKILTADYYFRELRESRNLNQYFSAIKMYEFIKEDQKKYGVYDRQFASIMSPWLEEFANPGFKKYGEAKLAQILPQIKSQNYDDIYTKAIIYKALANDKNKEYFNLTEVEFKKLTALSPELPINYFELAGLYFKKADYDQAILTYQTELTKLPDLTNPYLNADHKQIVENEMYKIYTGIGDSYLAKKNYIEAEKWYSDILNIDEKFYAAYGSLAELFQKKGDLNKAIWYNEKGMKAEPENYIWLMNLADIYKEKGDTVLYKEYLKKAELLAPDKIK